MVLITCTEMAVETPAKVSTAAHPAAATTLHLPTFKWGATRPKAATSAASHKRGASVMDPTVLTPFLDDEMKKRKKEKPTEFTLGLTRHEIDKDILAMTGAKPRRRPKRRPKSVQAEIKSLFPGSMLPKIIKPERYKVPEQKSSGRCCPKS